MKSLSGNFGPVKKKKKTFTNKCAVPDLYYTRSYNNIPVTQYKKKTTKVLCSENTIINIIVQTLEVTHTIEQPVFCYSHI